MGEDYVVCGRVIGSATGWGQGDTYNLQLYGFRPALNYKGPVADSVGIDFEAGLIETYTDNGTVVQSTDLIDAINDCKRDIGK
jgi:hypothetical protein